jgi:hypothetical protein
MSFGIKYIWAAAFLPLLILAGALIATAVPVYGYEVVSPDGGFSYQLPKGWKLVNARGARYKVAVDPHDRAKIVVNTNLAIYVIDDYDGRNLLPQTVERFRYETLKRAAKRDPDCEVIENSKFTTNSNQQGLRTLLRVKRNGVLFHDSLYFFEHYAKIVWIVCSGPGDGSMDEELQAIMKTFRSHET